jgi:chromosomal replication initiator protein
MNTEEQFGKIWQSVSEMVSTYSNVAPSQVDAFFSRVHIEAMSGNFIVITAETPFIKDWITKYYFEYIQRALHEMFGEDFEILFEVSSVKGVNTTTQVVETTSLPLKQIETNNPPAVLPEKAAETFVVQNTKPQENSALNQETQTLSEAEEEEQLIRDISPLTFENFVIGNSNSMAYKMALAVAEAPGKKVGLNPLFIYGKSGLGKTHLLRAIENQIRETFPKYKVVYVDSSEFLDEYTEASAAHDKNKRSFNNFKKRYETADVLLIDDVQFFQGKKGTLDNMFQIFNKLTNKGKQVVLSADRAPKNIDIDERYRSRFQSGGTFDIQPPEIETKLSIIRSYIDEYKASDPSAHFTITPEIQQYIAESSSSNIRELKGAVTVVITSLLSDPYLTIESVKQLLQNHFDDSAVIGITDIQLAIEKFFKISHSDLVGKKRARNIAYPRQLGIYLCKDILGDTTYDEIGKAFGRDHSTAVYAVKEIEKRKKESRQTQEEIEALQKIISER